MLRQDPAALSLTGFGPLSDSKRAGDALAGDDFVSSPAARLRRLASRAVLGIAVTMLFAAASLIWFRDSYEERIYPSVFVADMSVGGLAATEAREVLEARAAQLENEAITFTYRDKTWSPALSELGVSIDTESSLQEALNIGREEEAWSRVVSTSGLLRNEHNVPLQMSLDTATLNRWFDTVDGELGLPPHDAYLVIDGDTVTIEEEVAGTIVDRAAAEQAVVSTLHRLQPTAGPLPVVAMVPKIHGSDLAAAHEQLQTALSKPVKLKLGGDTWSLKPEELGQFVVQNVDPAKSGAAAFSLSLDQKALARWLNEALAEEVNRDPDDATVGWSDGLIALEESRDGRKLKPTSLAEDVAGSFFGNHATLKVPVATIKPEVDSDNLDALGITTRLGAGSSNFDGSDEGRSTNIFVGTNLLNGFLIPPHGTFSFNHAIGVINEEKGYVESQVVDGERIGRDIGGGICQVSTTVFRAALLSGMPIVEWWPHRYRLGFYELDDWDPGMDASILQPEGDPFSGGDFKFENPTESWLLVEAYTQGTQVVVVLYGPRLGYDVQLSDPVLSDPIPPGDDLEIVDEKLPAGSIQHAEYRQEGLEVTYTRDVIGSDGEVVRSDQWTTTFSSRGDVYKVSPDMAGQSPASKS